MISARRPARSNNRAPQDATAIDTEADGTAGVAGESVDRALEAIRPHGPEHVWRPARPYMLPG